MVLDEPVATRRNLLDLIQHEHRTGFADGFEPCGLPLLADPVCAAECRLIGADVANRDAMRAGDLLNERGFSNLTGAGDDLQKPARLGEPRSEHGALRAPVVGLPFTHDIEYFYSTPRVKQTKPMDPGFAVPTT